VRRHADQRFDFARADVGLGEDHRPLAPERAQRSGQPFPRRGGVAFEQLQRSSEDPGQAQQAIGLLRLQPPLLLAPLQGAHGDHHRVREIAGGQARVALEALEGGEGEPLLHPLADVEGVLRAQPDQGHEAVGAGPAGLDRLAVRFEDFRHMAHNTLPDGGAQEP
jgi:hypothetical protein